MKSLRVAPGAQPENRDARIFDAARHQLRPVGFGEIHFSGSIHPEVRRNFRADMVAARANPRPDGGENIAGRSIEAPPHLLDGVRDNPRNSTSPSGMDCRDRAAV